MKLWRVVKKQTQLEDSEGDEIHQRNDRERERKMEKGCQRKDSKKSRKDTKGSKRWRKGHRWEQRKGGRNKWKDKMRTLRKKGWDEDRKQNRSSVKMNESNTPMYTPEAESRHGGRDAGGRGERRGESEGEAEREDISLPACSAESSQQVRARSLATAAVDGSRSSWLEPLLCSLCCEMFSTYYTQLTSSHRSFMQINVRPGDICLLTDSGLSFPLGAVREARGFNLSLQIYAHSSAWFHGGQLCNMIA